MEFLLCRNLFDTWLEHIHLSSDSLPNSIRWRCHVDVSYNSFLHVPSSVLLLPRGVPWSCRIHLGRPDVAAATLFTTSSLAQGSLEGWGASAWQAKCPFSRRGPESAGSRKVWGGTRRSQWENKCLVLKIGKDEKQIRGLKAQNPSVPGSECPRQWQCRVGPRQLGPWFWGHLTWADFLHRVHALQG